MEIMQQIPDGAADLILCDLPYGMTGCAWDSQLPLAPLWEQYNRIAKPNAAVLLFGVQPFTTTLIQSNRKNFRYCWYWQKNNVTGAPFAKVQPMRCIEDIAVFYQAKPTYNPQGLTKLEKPIYKRGPNRAGVYDKFRGKPAPQKYKGYPKHLLKIDNVGTSSKKRLHPTQKPVPLLEYLIKTYTNPGGLVLDNCMGSGSTGVAARNTGRRFVGIEKDAAYFCKAAARIDDPAAM